MSEVSEVSELSEMREVREVRDESVDYRYQSLVIFLNRHCTVGCASCNADARPGNNRELSSRWLSAFFPKVEDLKFSGYILWTGGEPFLSFEALRTGISIASGQGYHSEILTSGDWFNPHPEWLEPLAGNPHLSIRISLDAEHQEKVPLSHLISFIRRAGELHLEVNFTLREIPGQRKPANQYIEEIQRHLPGFYRNNRQRSRWLHYLPHIPIVPGGYNSSGILPGFSGSPKYKQPCKRAFQDLVIGEDGLVYPCCGLFGFSFHRRLAVGDPGKESWKDLIEKQYSHPGFRLLKEEGPYGLCSRLGLEPEKWGWPSFQSPCHLCMALFKQEERKVLRYFSPAQ